MVTTNSHIHHKSTSPLSTEETWLRDGLTVLLERINGFDAREKQIHERHARELKEFFAECQPIKDAYESLRKLLPANEQVSINVVPLPAGAPKPGERGAQRRLIVHILENAEDFLVNEEIADVISSYYKEYEFDKVALNNTVRDARRDNLIFGVAVTDEFGRKMYLNGASGLFDGRGGIDAVKSNYRQKLLDKIKSRGWSLLSTAEENKQGITPEKTSAPAATGADTESETDIGKKPSVDAADN